MDRPTRMYGGPTCRCLHACKVRGENDVISANSRSVRIRSPGCVIRSSVDWERACFRELHHGARALTILGE